MKLREKLLPWLSVCVVLIVCVFGARVVVCDDYPDEYEAELHADMVDQMPGSGPSFHRNRTGEEALSGGRGGSEYEMDGAGEEDDGVGEETHFKFDPHNPKNVALVSWAGAMDAPDARPAYEHITVGTFVATNVIVCVPSAQIPVRIHNTSNWYVHQVVIGSPQTTIDKDEFVVVYHQLFQMKRDSAHRIAMLVLDERGEAKAVASGMLPLLLTAIPFLPSLMVRRHDDYVLAMCALVVYEATGAGKFAAVPFVTTACRFNSKGRFVYKEKVCGYTKMMKQTREVISGGVMFPNDLGAPLICGNVLVGVYSGIQNLNGNRYSSKNVEVLDRSLNMSPEKMAKGEQYTFDVPGGLKNFEFLGAFIDQKKKKMKWSMKMEMHESNECIETHEDEEVPGTHEGDAEMPDQGTKTTEGIR